MCLLCKLVVNDIIIAVLFDDNYINVVGLLGNAADVTCTYLNYNKSYDHRTKILKYIFEINHLLIKERIIFGFTSSSSHIHNRCNLININS